MKYAVLLASLSQVEDIIRETALLELLPLAATVSGRSRSRLEAHSKRGLEKWPGSPVGISPAHCASLQLGFGAVGREGHGAAVLVLALLAKTGITRRPPADTGASVCIHRLILVF